jgi:hypothetical protein
LWLASISKYDWHDILNGDYSISKPPPYLSRLSNTGLQIIFFFLFFHQKNISTITEATMEPTLREATQREEVITKYWDCKLMLKEEADGPEIDLLDYLCQSF